MSHGHFWAISVSPSKNRVPDVTGDVTGNLTGDVTGDASGWGGFGWIWVGPCALGRKGLSLKVSQRLGNKLTGMKCVVYHNQRKPNIKIQTEDLLAFHFNNGLYVISTKCATHFRRMLLVFCSHWCCNQTPDRNQTKPWVWY